MRFYEKYWSQSRGGKPCDFPIKWPLIQRFLLRVEGVVIVDFGCGDGEVLREMAKLNPKARYIGLDVSETALSVALRNLPQAEFHKLSESESFPLSSDSVDMVLASEVIEHVYDTEHAFSEMARILRPGGILLLTTPYHGLIKNLLIVLFKFDRHFDPKGGHIRFFTKKTLFPCLREADLQPVRYGTIGRFYPIPKSMFVLARKGG